MSEPILTEDEEKRLLKQAQEEEAPPFPPTWTPQKEGDYVVGILRSVRTVTTRFGPRSIAEIQTKDGNLINVWLSHSSLMRFWDAKNPQPGDKVLIMYKGAKLTATGKVQYHIYSLAVERGSGAPAGNLETGTTIPQPPSAPKQKLPPVPEGEIEKIREFIGDIMTWYQEIEKDDLQKLLTMKGFNFDVDSVIKICELKVTSEGKVTK